MDGQPDYVVSYLVSASRDSNDWTPMGTLPANRMPSHVWEWRVFDPRSGRDRLFLKLSSFPLLTRWDSTFRSLEFIQGDEIVRVPWRFEAVPHVQVTLPTDSCLCDYWQDRTGGWHVVQQIEVRLPSEPGVVRVKNVGTRWDLAPHGGKWVTAVVDSSAGGHYGECYVTPNLQTGFPPPRLARMESLVAQMSGFGGDYSTLRRDPDGTDLVWVPSEFDTTLGLEMGAVEGDLYHAVKPVVWVDRTRKRRRPIYAATETGYDQLGFQERMQRVLIASEWEGAYPLVLDMPTGDVLFRVEHLSSGAVWVPAPADSGERSAPAGHGR